MKTIKALFTVAALTAFSTAALAADDSPAAQRVQQSLSQSLNDGVAQQADVSQETFADTGMSVAAGRLQQSISAELEGQNRSVVSQHSEYQNDAGKSVAATRVEQSINERV